MCRGCKLIGDRTAHLPAFLSANFLQAPSGPTHARPLPSFATRETAAENSTREVVFPLIDIQRGLLSLRS